MTKKTLSLCMIVKDEAHNLPRSLEPLLPHVDEAVVVDTGSRDGTAELAARLGARVFSFPWRDDFAAARNYSLDQATGDWLLWWDADNRLTPDDAASLRSLIQRPPGAVLWATEVLEPGGGHLLQKRIFPRSPEFRFRYRVHEQLCHPSNLAQVITPLHIYHWGYADRRQRRAKAQRNLAYLLADLQDRPDDFYVHYHLARHYFFAGQPAEALGHLEWVLAAPNLAGQNPEIARHAPLMTAQVWDRLGEAAEARRQLAKLLRIYPDYGLAWFHLGLIHFREGEPSSAAIALARFLELGTGHFFLDQPEEKLSLSAMLTLAQSLRQLERLDEAGEVLRQAQQKHPLQPGVWLETAAWAEASRDRSCARRALETCLSLRPDSRRAQVLLRGMEGAA